MFRCALIMKIPVYLYGSFINTWNDHSYYIFVCKNQVKGLIGINGLIPFTETIKKLHKWVIKVRFRNIIYSMTCYMWILIISMYFFPFSKNDRASDTIGIRYVSKPLTNLALHLIASNSMLSSLTTSYNKSMKLSKLNDISLTKITTTAIVISLLAIFSPNVVFFLILYVLYYTLKQIMGPFFNFQWDQLLLETGILTILLSASKTDSSTSSVLLLFQVKNGYQ
jgi:hypothetical protein